MGEDRAKKVYREHRRKMEQGEIEDTWCRRTKELMEEMRLQEWWDLDEIPGEEEDEQWEQIVRRQIQEREEERWRLGMASKPKLRLYRQLKKDWGFEQYLRLNTQD